MRKPKKERNLKLVDGKWYLDFTFNKKRIRQFGGYTKEQARTTLAKLRIEKLDEKLGYKKPGNQEDVSFEKFAKEFFETHSKHKRSWRRDQTSLQNLKTFFKGKNLSEITPSLIDKYKTKRKEKVSEASVNRELACLKTLFTKAVRENVVSENPAREIRLFREDPKKRRILNDNEIVKLMAAIEESKSEYLKAFVVISVNTAMRTSEVLSLKWDDINFLDRFILISISKNRKERKVPMNDNVINILNSLKRDNDYIFFNPETRGPVSRIQRSFKTACKTAEIKGVTPYSLRHTAITQMVNELGIDIVTVAQIVGHSSIEMTRRYCHPSKKIAQRAVDMLGQLFEGKTRQKVDSPENVVKVKKPVSPSISYN